MFLLTSFDTSVPKYNLRPSSKDIISPPPADIGLAFTAVDHLGLLYCYYFVILRSSGSSCVGTFPETGPEVNGSHCCLFRRFNIRCMKTITIMAASNKVPSPAPREAPTAATWLDGQADCSAGLDVVGVLPVGDWLAVDKVLELDEDWFWADRDTFCSTSGCNVIGKVLLSWQQLESSRSS